MYLIKPGEEIISCSNSGIVIGNKIKANKTCSKLSDRQELSVLKENKKPSLEKDGLYLLTQKNELRCFSFRSLIDRWINSEI